MRFIAESNRDARVTQIAMLRAMGYTVQEKEHALHIIDEYGNIMLAELDGLIDYAIVSSAQQKYMPANYGDHGHYVVLNFHKTSIARYNAFKR